MNSVYMISGSVGNIWKSMHASFVPVQYHSSCSYEEIVGMRDHYCGVQ